MLGKTQMQEIQDLKLRGYTKAEIITYYEGLGMKPPSRPTISKYYDMDVVPDDPGEKLAKDKAFDASPFREAVITILESNSRKDFCISSVYDLLEEKFIENGNYASLPGNEQTLRNYVHYLEDTGQINLEEGHRRIYDHVFDTPPGEQMLIDFGEYTIDKRFGFYKDAKAKEWKSRPHGESVEKFKRKLKSLTNRSQSMEFKVRIQRINWVIRGWINYFALGSMKTVMTEIDEHLRTRLRVIIWKQSSLLD